MGRDYRKLTPSQLEQQYWATVEGMLDLFHLLFSHTLSVCILSPCLTPPYTTPLILQGTSTWLCTTARTLTAQRMEGASGPFAMAILLCCLPFQVSSNFLSIFPLSLPPPPPQQRLFQEPGRPLQQLCLEPQRPPGHAALRPETRRGHFRYGRRGRAPRRVACLRRE